MPEILKPDLKALVWLGLGFFIVPMAMKYVPFAFPGKGE